MQCVLTRGFLTTGNPLDACGNPCSRVGKNEINECVNQCGDPLQDKCGSPVSLRPGSISLGDVCGYLYALVLTRGSGACAGGPVLS